MRNKALDRPSNHLWFVLVKEEEEEEEEEKTMVVLFFFLNVKSLIYLLTLFRHQNRDTVFVLRLRWRHRWLLAKQVLMENAQLTLRNFSFISN